MIRKMIAVALIAGMATVAEGARVKDLAQVRGVRSNQLIGYGLVVGLAGTGDDQQVYFTLRSVQLMLRRLGVQAAQEMVFDLRNLRLRNAAAVMVTADLPPFARAGSRLDVTVSSLGNATSLQGGTLIMTPLLGVDLKVYALSQGALSVGGFRVGGRTGSQAVKNHTTVARIPGGALVEREVASRFVVKDQMVVALSRPDFTTASRTAEAIVKAIGKGTARAVDPATIAVKVPKGYAGREVELVSKLEALEVEPDVAAQVIVNERTGTVIVGQTVKLSPVAITHGALTLEVNERYRVSQPRAPFGTGRTAVVPETTTTATEGSGELKLLPASASLSDVVKALNALGAAPRDLIAILQALETAGALPAKVVVQ
jgi:flagellar P-ring protein precursor FlgI